jgi:hypothetical protein
MARRPVATTTGREVCADCHDDLMATAAGVLANPGAPVAGAIATLGWKQRLRAWRRSSSP